MAYNASIQAKWDWENAVSLAEERAAKAAAEKERAKAEREKYEEKLQSARQLKAFGKLTDRQIAESLQLPIEVVEGL